MCGLEPPHRVVAYATLLCGEIVAQGENGEPLTLDPDADYDYCQWPAIKIARLAVDQSVRREGLGITLGQFALGIAREAIAPLVGCRFVVVDAKADSMEFYRKKLGFRILDTDENRARPEPVMFYDLYGLET